MRRNTRGQAVHRAQHAGTWADRSRVRRSFSVAAHRARKVPEEDGSLRCEESGPGRACRPGRGLEVEHVPRDGRARARASVAGRQLDRLGVPNGFARGGAATLRDVRKRAHPSQASANLPAGGLRKRAIQSAHCGSPPRASAGQASPSQPGGADAAAPGDVVRRNRAVTSGARPSNCDVPNTTWVPSCRNCAVSRNPPRHRESRGPAGDELHVKVSRS